MGGQGGCRLVSIVSSSLPRFALASMAICSQSEAGDPIHPTLFSSALGTCTDEQEGTGRAIAHAQQKYKDVKAKAKGIDKA